MYCHSSDPIGTHVRVQLAGGVRRAIADVPIRYAGFTAWRGVSSVPVEAGRLTESWGIGERFGLVDIGRGRTYWFATKNAPEGAPDEPGGRKAESYGAFPAGTSRSRRSSGRPTRAPFCATTSTT